MLPLPPVELNLLLLLLFFFPTIVVLEDPN